eukprot:TRINITY_DN6397_c0_g1_i8.p2 TRINITY_DN6397_c0_g1~~TRINITY_DN6397_c0_g1_i8.p2  ORF type:complete len:243 (+),score=69.44 TRINITY_DN6397_c0_g1_i8:167-895(+)
MCIRDRLRDLTKTIKENLEKFYQSYQIFSNSLFKKVNSKSLKYHMKKEEAKAFSAIEMTPEKQEDILVEIQNDINESHSILQKYDDALEKVNIILISQQHKLDELYFEIKQQENIKKILNEQIEILKKNNIQMQKENSELRATRKEIKESLIYEEKQIKQLKDQKSNFEEENSQLREENKKLMILNENTADSIKEMIVNQSEYSSRLADLCLKIEEQYEELDKVTLDTEKKERSSRQIKARI